jgi:hypothetical protein
MAIKVPTKYLIIAIAFAILALFIGGWWLGMSKQRKALKSLSDAYSDTIRQYTLTINGKTAHIAQVEQQLATEKEVKKALELTNKDLRKLNIRHINEINRLNLQIDTLLTQVFHNGEIIIVQQQTIDSLSHDTVSVKKNAILLPFDWKK